MLKQTLKNIVGESVNTLFPSPSKMFLLRKMQCFLSQYQGFPVGLDIAASDLKYRYMFKVQTYIGIDREQDLLEQGKVTYPEQNTLAKTADFFDIAHLPQIADIVVSTHTLAHLPQAKRMQAIELLVKCTKRGGGLFFNLPYSADEQIIKTLNESFIHVKQINYASKFSMSIEKYFNDKTGYKGGLKFIALTLAIIFSWLLSFFEGCWQPKDPAYSLLICQHRMLNEPSSNDLDTLLSDKLPAQS